MTGMCEHVKCVHIYECKYATCTRTCMHVRVHVCECVWMCACVCECVDVCVCVDQYVDKCVYARTFMHIV